MSARSMLAYPFRLTALYAVTFVILILAALGVLAELLLPVQRHLERTILEGAKQ